MDLALAGIEPQLIRGVLPYATIIVGARARSSAAPAFLGWRGFVIYFFFGGGVTDCWPKRLTRSDGGLRVCLTIRRSAGSI